MAAPRILHLLSSFSATGRAGRAVRLMNAWGPRARHVIVSDAADALGARDLIAPDVSFEVAQDPPPLTGRPSVARYEALARLMRGHDLVLTYGWGAVDGVMARRVFGRGAPPVIHHEDGFDADEAGGLKPERNLYRRIALSAAHALVVPSTTLRNVALTAWRQPEARVRHIPNGVDADLYAARPTPDAIPGFLRRKNEVVVGTLAGLRPVKDLPALVRAVAGLSGRVRLVIAGDGPERAAIARAAANMGIEDRVLLPGHLDHPHRFVGLFDVLALSSLSEQMPTSVLEAMAAGLPVAAPRVGDVATMVSAENAPYLAGDQDVLSLRDALQPMVDSRPLRDLLGIANRRRALADHDEATMIARYAALYEGAMNRPGALIA
jgi:glycosyltransferase involved in cell wall biosynthesis